jgi:hypothetical protein
MSETGAWYVVKLESGECAIVSATELATPSVQPANPSEEQWGPFDLKEDAIARRVGLIRSGKCKPVLK